MSESIAVLNHSSVHNFTKDQLDRIDDLGKLSAIAQKLRHSITTTKAIQHIKEQTIFCISTENTIIGYIKTGPKSLFAIVLIP
jgi:hypothetical protein